jgi:hypothetical protein
MYCNLLLSRDQLGHILRSSLPSPNYRVSAYDEEWHTSIPSGDLMKGSSMRSLSCAAAGLMIIIWSVLKYSKFH